LKIQHCEGGHDDSLFAYLVGRYVLAYGKNLNKFMIIPNGEKTLEERKSSLVRMNHELSMVNNLNTSNNPLVYQNSMNQLEKIDRFNSFKQASSQNSRMGFYTRISKLDDDEYQHYLRVHKTDI